MMVGIGALELVVSHIYGVIKFVNNPATEEALIIGLYYEVSGADVSMQQLLYRWPHDFLMELNSLECSPLGLAGALW